MDALLDSGRHGEMIAELETLTANYALRERFWSQRLLALYRCGRQADALRAYRELRTILVGQLGIEPGPEVRELEARILRQDAELDYRPARHTEGDDKARPGTRYVAERRRPHRLSGPRTGRAGHRLRAGGDEPPRSAVGRP